MRRAAAVALFLVLSLAAVAKDDPNVHEVPGAGVSLTKPDRWTFQTKTASMVVIQNSSEAGDGSVFVLTLQAMATPPANVAPQLLGYIAGGLQQKYADFTVEKPARATTVAGRHAAELTASYTHTEGTKSVRIHSRLILVPREGGILVINMTAPPDAGETSRKEMASILDSVKIAK